MLSVRCWLWVQQPAPSWLGLKHKGLAPQLHLLLLHFLAQPWRGSMASVQATGLWLTIGAQRVVPSALDSTVYLHMVLKGLLHAHTTFHMKAPKTLRG